MLNILSHYYQHIKYTFIENVNKLNALTKYENNIIANSNYRICQLLKRKTFQTTITQQKTHLLIVIDAIAVSMCYISMETY